MSTYSKNRNDNRKQYLDILKMVAIYLVIFNHTGSEGYYLFAESVGTKWYAFYLFISIGIKIAVPIFFMISGTLLLTREESYLDIIKKRVIKYFVVLFIFSFAQYLWSVGFQFRDVSIIDFMMGFYSKPYAATYWYLYAYLAFLLMLPLLRKAVIGMNTIDFCWLVILRSLSVSVFPLFQYLVLDDSVTVYHGFNVVIATNDILFYPIVGYYIDNCLDIRKIDKKQLITGAIVSIMLIVISGVLTHGYGIDNDTMYVEKFHNMFIYFPAMMFFIVIKKIVMEFECVSCISNITKILGETTLGIMLLEAPIRSKTEFIYIFLQDVMGDMLACMLWVFVCLIIGIFITLILKKMPVFKRIL